MDDHFALEGAGVLQAAVISGHFGCARRCLSNVCQGPMRIFRIVPRNVRYPESGSRKCGCAIGRRSHGIYDAT